MFNVVPQIIQRTEQCKVCMLIAWLKLKHLNKAVIVAHFMLTSKRNGEFNCHKTFDSFHLISQLLLPASNYLKYKWIAYLRNILYRTKM